MEEVNVKIGFLIEKLRKEQMLTQVQLAKEIMSKNILSFIETGWTKISLPQLLLLLDKLNVTFFKFVALLPPDVTENKKKKYISDRLH
ncbi:helix-turn-helix transcriptional regulator [Enterococcus durans]|uniref:Helix-turn-helix transcriptional regulator n=1 Tax=Enterococcus durans TaxID=53345 RepID=A0A5N0YLF4_9ENTE|nr:MULTISPECIES: helix-turn-helix transcriptional regulator [Enterococcus]KAA9177019.1 helix-turn-helix transcriptional regulator [Enterococcus durans]KAA9182619.1 helix-turn-helix transcriptional regulator [Enterococcus durans]KAA9183903.1 helix-turn-helix transcriptional regulator [Enterococcus durans]KAA9188685.1 helix-turn-helix transcriptional regulator [Enterococcus durans]KAA9190607.1 helix-turn-helix transcriptional regulator [Enterococcus durans]